MSQQFYQYQPGDQNNIKWDPKNGKVPVSVPYTTWKNERKESCSDRPGDKASSWGFTLSSPNPQPCGSFSLAPLPLPFPIFKVKVVMFYPLPRMCQVAQTTVLKNAAIWGPKALCRTNYCRSTSTQDPQKCGSQRDSAGERDEMEPMGAKSSNPLWQPSWAAQPHAVCTFFYT